MLCSTCFSHSCARQTCSACAAHAEAPARLALSSRGSDGIGRTVVSRRFGGRAAEGGRIIGAVQAHEFHDARRLQDRRHCPRLGIYHGSQRECALPLSNWRRRALVRVRRRPIGPQSADASRSTRLLCCGSLSGRGRCALRIWRRLRRPSERNPMRRRADGYR